MSRGERKGLVDSLGEYEMGCWSAEVVGRR